MRTFLKGFKILTLLVVLCCFQADSAWAQVRQDQASSQKQDQVSDQQQERTYLISALTKIADPLLTSLSKDELKKKMPVETTKGAWDDRRHVTYLEGFGRLMSGMAPWLALGPDDSPEGKLREQFIQKALLSLHHATNPEAADFMNFTEGDQPLVDAAFLAQGLLRAPDQLWERMGAETQENVISALKSSRQISPYYSNWLLFSAMVEAALLKFDGKADMMRIEYALNKHMEWYLGDGTYGDGPEFHWDYYNSFVIQPMMLDILKTLKEAEEEGNKNVEQMKNVEHEKRYEQVLERARRYAALQERLISPEGTYPPIGRSLAYRFGAFQLLSQMALWNTLPEELSSGQVRQALYTVVKKQIEAPGTFDENGWLKIGFYGHQPDIGEGYISTGSLYLCAEVFLVLGQDQQEPFWTSPAEDWTQKKIWNGKDIPIDHALHE